MTNNAFNNDIFCSKLMKNFKKICSKSFIEFDYDSNENDKNDFENITHLFCLIHIIQLSLQNLLNLIRMKSINEKFQKIDLMQKNSKILKIILKKRNYH